MKKVTIKLVTYPLISWAPDRYSLTLMGSEGPSKIVEITSTADAKKAVVAFAEELVSTGKAWMVSAVFLKKYGGRKPNGFDKASLDAFVNKHLVAGKDVFGEKVKEDAVDPEPPAPKGWDVVDTTPEDDFNYVGSKHHY